MVAAPAKTGVLVEPRSTLAGARITCNTCYVANLTLAIDDTLLRKARIRALEQGTSVNELVRNYLTSLTTTDDALTARQAFVADAMESKSGSGVEGRTWTRDEIYDRPYPGSAAE